MLGILSYKINMCMLPLMHIMHYCTQLLYTCGTCIHVQVSRQHLKIYNMSHIYYYRRMV